jgi:methyltransferase family protein
MAVRPASVERIRRQGSNSGGFERAVEWELLDHPAHHPGLRVEVRGGERIAGRERRQRHVFESHRERMTGVVVDVGCDRAVLRSLVSGRYVGLDRFGDPDVRADLLTGRPLPLRDRAADFVVCTDVLEHLYDPHFYFDELCRISREWVLVGLPNCWTAGWPAYRAGVPTYKNYGLSPERHRDAHRWYFCTEESIDFVLYRGARAGFRGEVMTHFTGGDPYGLAWPGLVGRALGKASHWGHRLAAGLLERRGSRTWLNRRVEATWWLLRRHA